MVASSIDIAYACGSMLALIHLIFSMNFSSFSHGERKLFVQAEHMLLYQLQSVEQIAGLVFSCEVWDTKTASILSLAK
jgi:hypothetical protein